VNPIIGLMYGKEAGQRLPPVRLPGRHRAGGHGRRQARGKDETAAAAFRGIAARSAMDNAMFAVNFFSGIGGLDLAYVAHKVTVQAEATLLQLLRVRHKAIEPDDKRTNFTAGLHLGYFVLPVVSLAGEVRYQRWLSDPALLKTTPTARETATFAVGPRFHFKVAGTTWIRPGISYARAFDKPLKDSKYHIVQLDLPVGVLGTVGDRRRQSLPQGLPAGVLRDVGAQEAGRAEVAVVDQHRRPLPRRALGVIAGVGGEVAVVDAAGDLLGGAALLQIARQQPAARLVRWVRRRRWTGARAAEGTRATKTPSSSSRLTPSNESARCSPQHLAHASRRRGRSSPPRPTRNSSRQASTSAKA
jgi:hypothetical protein